MAGEPFKIQIRTRSWTTWSPG